MEQIKGLKPDAQVHLNKFSPRKYQLPILDAIENKGYKRVIAIMPRRAGKDVTAFNLCIRACVRKPCVIYYIFPTYAQGNFSALYKSSLIVLKVEVASMANR